MNNNILIEKLLSTDFKGSADYISGARDGMYTLDRNLPSHTGDRDCEELKKEVERLKGLIEKLFKSPTHQAAMRAFDIDPEPEWEAFKQESNL